MISASVSVICLCIYIYISFPAIIEYGTETLASPGIPGIEFENRYLEYS